MTILPDIRRKALCIAISYKHLKSSYPKLVLPCAHKDTRIIKDLLIGHYGYQSKDITILMDDGRHVEPTRDNILRAIDDLIDGARSGDRFVFHFSGHGFQIPNYNGTEEDGKDEVIFPSDVVIKNLDDAIDSYENHIIDDEIRHKLVDCLPQGCHLTMIFDCCNSGTAADLPSYNQDIYPASPDVEISNADRWVFTTGELELNRKCSLLRQIQPNALKAPIGGSTFTGGGSIKKSKRARLGEDFPYITSWSACKDGQNTFESTRGGLFVTALEQAIRQKPQLTNGELLHSLTHEIKVLMEEGNKRGPPQSGPYISPRPQFSAMLDWKELVDWPLGF